MAKIVLGMGTSHGPMLSTPPDQWGQRAIFDRGVIHHYKGRTWTFDELSEERKNGFFDREIMPELWRSRHAACRRALDKLADVFAEIGPDLVVIVGNDFDESIYEHRRRDGIYHLHARADGGFDCRVVFDDADELRELLLHQLEGDALVGKFGFFTSWL